MNYTQLSQAIQDYLEETEATFVSNIPRFVRQAEERITRNTMIPAFRENKTGNTTSGDRFMKRPTDYLAPMSFAVIDGSGDYHYLLHKEVSFIREAYPDNTTSGLPQFYAEFDEENFILGPTPDAVYTLQLHYYYDPQSIVDASSGTTWLGDNAETALLWGSIVEAYTFLKGEPDLMQVYEGRFQQGMADLQKLGDFRNKRDNYRGGEPRLEVQA